MGTQGAMRIFDGVFGGVCAEIMSSKRASRPERRIKQQSCLGLMVMSLLPECLVWHVSIGAYNACVQGHGHADKHSISSSVNIHSINTKLPNGDAIVLRIYYISTLATAIILAIRIHTQTYT